MQTQPLYLEDSYLKSTRSIVLSLDTSGKTTSVVLDKTVLFPTGGGQPCDFGIIKGKDGYLDVTNVVLTGDKIVHQGKLNGSLNVDESVNVAVNWERRYLNMQVHSAGHVLHEAVKLISPNIVPIDAQHGKSSYINYNGEIDKQLETTIKAKVNELISSSLPVNTEFVSLDELKRRASWIPEHLPKNKPLRIMWIGSYDPIPDGGTQVKNTSELPHVSVIQLKGEGGNTKIFYKLEKRLTETKATDSSSAPSLTKEELTNLKNQTIAQISGASSAQEVEEIRLNLFGRNGKLSLAIKSLKDLDTNTRKEVGILINEVKSTLEKLLAEQKNDLKETTKKWFDPTIPVGTIKVGRLHPTSMVISEMVEIFKSLGFSSMEGPEIETDKYNFELLNLPKDHPARSLQDVLYIDEPEVLLRSHTSSVETRSIESLKPPFRIVVAGKCYRFENVNASNNAMFYQFQGVALQEGLSMADLKGTLYQFVRSYFGEDRKIRYRCKYYPEVEPGVGLDLDCQFCNQKGCSICKGRGWLEMLGAGMIHPNILKNFGYDPKEISGFAFGMGLDRIVMDRFKISDIRSLYNGDIKY